MAGCALTSDVTCALSYAWSEGLLADDGAPLPALRAPGLHVVVVDLGLKRTMLRLLVHHGCRVTVVPAHTLADAIFALAPDGVLLTNGPGDPSTSTDVVDTTARLLGEVPVFGICMGHQILAQALGASTFKTRFGHRGANQPVLAPDGRVLITSQNHGFAVDPAQLCAGVTASHTNLSDGTNEGVAAPERWAFGVQYHPEAAPGPRDAEDHFARFVELMERFRQARHGTQTRAEAGQAKDLDASVSRTPPVAGAS